MSCTLRMQPQIFKKLRAELIDKSIISEVLCFFLFLSKLTHFLWQKKKKKQVCVFLFYAFQFLWLHFFYLKIDVDIWSIPCALPLCLFIICLSVSMQLMIWLIRMSKSEKQMQIAWQLGVHSYKSCTWLKVFGGNNTKEFILESVIFKEDFP